jgi:aspartyl-tRNA(Asn)/glutamyl-tRNA(Gln) amidotransferase subunit C
MKQECNFMEITKDLVQYLENLGRLELSPEDEEKTQKALGDILGYFYQLNELDTEGVEPLSHAAGVSNVTREDVVTNEDMRDAVLSNAPETKDGTILVPKTFD